MLPTNDTILLFYWLGSFAYLLIAAIGLRSPGQRSPHPFLLAAYALVSALVLLVQAAWRMGNLAVFQEDFLKHTLLYGSLILTWLFIEVDADFLQMKGKDRRLWWGSLALLIGFVILDSNLLALPENLKLPGLVVLSRSRSSLAALVVSWAVLVCVSIWLLRASYQRYPQPLHRNRLVFWTPVILLNLVGDGLIFQQNPVLGSSLRLFATVLILYMASVYDLPDLRHGFRQFLIYGLITLFSIAFYMLGYIALENILGGRVGMNGLWLGTLMAIITAILFNPLLRLIQRLIDRLISGSYSPIQFVHEYSLKISNILDLDRLAGVSIQLLAETLKFSRGFLFIVSSEAEQEGGNMERYRLEAIRGAGEDIPSAGRLSATSPIAVFFRQMQRPITQYDLNLRDLFSTALPDEKYWFSQTGLDVYVPIVTHGKWIGLFMLGPKRSGERYFAEDLSLLGAIAGNTAVALENARLVRDLVSLNHQLEEAYHALDRTNQQLEKLDKTKSDFISIASHELRTPLTVLSGYSQILEECLNTGENPYLLDLVKGINSGALRLHEVIESMLDMATIDAKVLTIQPQLVTLGDLVSNITARLEKPLAERRLKITIAKEYSNLSFPADLDGLKKVFYHLLINAIKYTPDGGVISISALLLQPTDSPLGQEAIEIIIKDAGIGIDPALQELIFTKFYQTGELVLHSTSKTKFKGGGPGLGLAIVRGIVEAHRGKVWAESPGYDEVACPGSAFHVLLPVGEEQTSSD